MTRDDIRNEYFYWLVGLVCNGRFSKENSFENLLAYLHETEFVYLIPKDVNRANDGINLRWRFECEEHHSSNHHGPCSVLEMMVALAVRCEEAIMDNPSYGDRTGQWFWGMIVNLGLGSMSDSNFDRRYVEETVNRFLNREYEPDGRGGLFRVKQCTQDLRDVEIWYQLCWYLDSIT